MVVVLPIQIWEYGVKQYIDQGFSNYFNCDNKARVCGLTAPFVCPCDALLCFPPLQGCYTNQPIALDLADPSNPNSAYTATITIVVPRGQLNVRAAPYAAFTRVARICYVRRVNST